MSETQPRDDLPADTVTITRGDGWFVARDGETGVVSQGRTRYEALASLAEALALHADADPDGLDIGEPDAPWF